MVAEQIAMIGYVSVGGLLVFGSQRIAEVLTGLRYDPDTIPKQQISIAALIIALVVIAVVLGVVRRLSVGAI